MSNILSLFYIYLIILEGKGEVFELYPDREQIINRAFWETTNLRLPTLHDWWEMTFYVYLGHSLPILRLFYKFDIIYKTYLKLIN